MLSGSMSIIFCVLLVVFYVALRAFYTLLYVFFASSYVAIMLLRTRARMCMRHDFATGIPSDYLPRFRPRRLVMPVDSWKRHSPRRTPQPLQEFHDYSKRRRKETLFKHRGATQLSTVPKERTTADAVRLALDLSERNGYTHVSSLLPPEAAAVMQAVTQCQNVLALINKDTAGAAKVNLAALSEKQTPSSSCSIVDIGASADRGSKVVSSSASRIWELLSKTSMDSPAHGVLAVKGKSIVETVLLKALYVQYPRMRSHHAQEMIHQSTGLLSAARVAVRLGLVDMFNVHLEVGLWRELNTLTERLRYARKMLSVHRARKEIRNSTQRFWWWKKVTRSCERKLKGFPLLEEHLRPHLEWLRDQVFQFVAAVESMEGHSVAEKLVQRLFFGQLFRYLACKDLATDAERLQQQCSVAAASTDHQEALERSRLALDVSLRDFTASMAEDTTGFSTLGSFHPLTERQRQKREQENSSFGDHAQRGVKVPLSDTYRAERMKDLAPAAVVRLIDPRNAFREAQIVLRYDPFVQERLRNAPIDVDITVRNQVEVEEAEKSRPQQELQHFQQTQYQVARLFAGDACIGEGKGESDIQAIHEASLHMLQHYYLRKPQYSGTETNNTPQSKSSVQPASFVESPRVRSVAEEDTIFF